MNRQFDLLPFLEKRIHWDPTSTILSFLPPGDIYGYKGANAQDRLFSDDQVSERISRRYWKMSWLNIYSHHDITDSIRETDSPLLLNFLEKEMGAEILGSLMEISRIVYDDCTKSVQWILNNMPIRADTLHPYGIVFWNRNGCPVGTHKTLRVRDLWYFAVRSMHVEMVESLHKHLPCDELLSKDLLLRCRSAAVADFILKIKHDAPEHWTTDRLRQFIEEIPSSGTAWEQALPILQHIISHMTERNIDFLLHQWGCTAGGMMPRVGWNISLTSCPPHIAHALGECASARYAAIMMNSGKWGGKSSDSTRIAHLHTRYFATEHAAARKRRNWQKP